MRRKGPGLFPRGRGTVADIQRRIADIDAEIKALHRDGYSVDVDRLLDERAELQAWLEVAWAGVTARS